VIRLRYTPINQTITTWALIMASWKKLLLPSFLLACSISIANAGPSWMADGIREIYRSHG
jgi:hypothetical protein